jgi:tetratricopeptide (TPR) repeat protein
MRLAHHYEEAGEVLIAARWHRRAAEWAGRTDFAAAAHHWGRVRTLLRGLPGDGEAAALGIAACMQLLALSWRMGMGIDEARALLEEGQALANAIGDQRAFLQLSMVYGRARCSAGDVAEYLELAAENQRVALQIDDTAVQANASMFLVDALRFATRLPEALQLAEEGLARFPRHIPSEEWLARVNPYTVISLWRGYCLGWTGRLPEGLEELGRSRRFAEEDGTPETAGWSLSMAAQASYNAHDAERALASARKVEEISRALGNHPVLVALAQLAFGYAHLAAGRAADAIESARAALDIFGRVEKQMAGRATALLAEAILQTGDHSAALDTAQKAIAICRSSLSGSYEAVAHGVMARALMRRDGAAAHEAVEAALANAAELIERTGAKTLAPALCEWRAELAGVLGDDTTREQLLRQAQQGYVEIGAPGHTDRIAKELPA